MTVVESAGDMFAAAMEDEALRASVARLLDSRKDAAASIEALRLAHLGISNEVQRTLGELPKGASKLEAVKQLAASIRRVQEGPWAALLERLQPTIAALGRAGVRWEDERAAMAALGRAGWEVLPEDQTLAAEGERRLRRPRK